MMTSGVIDAANVKQLLEEGNTLTGKTANNIDQLITLLKALQSEQDQNRKPV
jgi:hypothetical protein